MQLVTEKTDNNRFDDQTRIYADFSDYLNHLMGKSGSPKEVEDANAVFYRALWGFDNFL